MVRAPRSEVMARDVLLPWMSVNIPPWISVIRVVADTAAASMPIWVKLRLLRRK